MSDAGPPNVRDPDDWQTCNLEHVRVQLGPPAPTRRDPEETDDDQAKIVAVHASANARFSMAAGWDTDDWSHEGDDQRRYLVPCPACQPERSKQCQNGDGNGPPGLLVLTRSLSATHVTAVCLGNCKIASVGRAIARTVIDYEAAERQRGTDELERETLAACSIGLLANVGPQNWTIDNVVPDASLTLLVGASGSGKTFAAMSTAIAVAAGTPWLAHRSTQGRVVLVLLEGAKVDHNRRIAAIAIGLGTSMEALKDRLLIYPSALKTDDPQSFAAFLKFLTIVKPRLLVIDNLSEIRSARGQGSENDSTAVGQAIRPLAQLAHGDHASDGVPATAVMLLHHANAAGGTRGGDGIKQHADHILELDRASDRNESPISVRRGKSRSGGGAPEFAVRFTDRKDGAIVLELVRAKRDVEETKSVDRDAERKAQILELLPLASQELYDAMSGDPYKCGSTVCKRVRDRLELDGAIAQRDGVWHRMEE